MTRKERRILAPLAVVATLLSGWGITAAVADKEAPGLPEPRGSWTTPNGYTWDGAKWFKPDGKPTYPLRPVGLKGLWNDGVPYDSDVSRQIQAWEREAYDREFRKAYKSYTPEAESKPVAETPQVVPRRSDDARSWNDAGYVPPSEYVSPIMCEPPQ